MTSTTSPSTATARPHAPWGLWAATGCAAANVLLWGFALGLFIVTTVGLSLVVVTAGIVMLLVSVPLTQVLADAHRALGARALGVEVPPAGYRPTAGTGVFGRLLVWVKDPARWRDYLWTFVDTLIGFVLPFLALLPLVAAVWWLVYPLVFVLTPRGVFDMELGFTTLDTVGESFLTWIAAAIALLLWVTVTPALVRVKARVDLALLSPPRTEQLERRVQDLATSRAESVDFSAAEIRRIERDLHDGAQARLAALGMSLGLADELLERDPEQARRLLAEARTVSSAALGDIRSVVRGIHPPVLADRGIAGAVQALAMDLTVPVMLTVELPGRPPAPVESAVYFAVAECLANVVKHADAARAWVTMRHSDGVLRVEVGDDGQGGAAAEKGTGMLGVMRRLSAFDGTMAVSSPPGGPTLVVMEVPCELSSPKTTPSSGTA